MRDPRIDPQKGDVVQHADGERRVVTARKGDFLVRYLTSDSGLSAICSPEQWKHWAKKASIVEPDKT